jgi:hypothetical protein
VWAEAEYRIRSTLAKKPQGLTPLCTFDKLHALWLTNLVLLTHGTQEVAKDSLEPPALNPYNPYGVGGLLVLGDMPSSRRGELRRTMAERIVAGFWGCST